MNTLHTNGEPRATAWWDRDSDLTVAASGVPIPGPQEAFWRGAAFAAVLGLGVWALALVALWAVLRWL